MVDLSNATRSSGEGKVTHSVWISELGFHVLAGAIDLLAIVVAAVVVGTGYHLWLGSYVQPQNYIEFALLVSLFYITFRFVSKKYSIVHYTKQNQELRLRFVHWSHAFLLMLLVLFITKTSDVVSRGTVISFYFVGFFALLAVFSLKRYLVEWGTQKGLLGLQRALFVGDKNQINRFFKQHNPLEMGFTLVDTVELRTEGSFPEGIKNAVKRARDTNADDVFVLLPWCEKNQLRSVIEEFRQTPTSIHLLPEGIMESYKGLSMEHFGDMSSLRIVRRPLSILDRAIKRSIDILGAVVGLMILAIIIPFVAYFIRRESEGDLFFRQERGGFNGKPFYIYKFRSLRNEPRKQFDENGLEVVRQVTDQDDRMTEVGNFLRRTNIDELPQLLNVLRGEMSLVGPRPHALQHDQQFQEKVADYARRHNVKPGITGLAQVMGYRGETDTDEKIRGRVKFDLQYVDRWSLWQDIKIIWMTVFSDSARKNAK